jgi:transposase-like protein
LHITVFVLFSIQQIRSSSSGVERYSCPDCNRSFTRSDKLVRHTDTVHNRQRHVCPVCGRVYNRADNLQKHIKKTHNGSVATPPPPPPPSRKVDRQRHVCHVCSRVYTKAGDLVRHIELEHDVPAPATTTSSPSSRKRPAAQSEDPSVTTDKRQKFDDDEPHDLQNLPIDLRKIYTAYWSTIKTHSNIYDHVSTYNFFHNPLTTTHPIDWSALLTDVFTRQTKRFKINYSHHTILRHRETHDLRFFHASSNNSCVLTVPKLINNRKDFDAFLSHLHESDILNFTQHNRPNTKYVVEAIPATSFYFYHIHYFPIG